LQGWGGNVAAQKRGEGRKTETLHVLARVQSAKTGKKKEKESPGLCAGMSDGVFETSRHRGGGGGEGGGEKGNATSVFGKGERPLKAPDSQEEKRKEGPFRLSSARVEGSGAQGRAPVCRMQRKGRKKK